MAKVTVWVNARDPWVAPSFNTDKDSASAMFGIGFEVDERRLAQWTKIYEDYAKLKENLRAMWVKADDEYEAHMREQDDTHSE